MALTYRDLSKLIDHSLLHPTLTDAEIVEGCKLARRYDVATACVKPYSIPLAKETLAGSDVGICPVIGFPHGNSATAIKVAEATAAARRGGSEIDMVINVGKAIGGDWGYVADEIRAINDAVVSERAILKVIFENDFLPDDQIIRLCAICSEIGVAFVKTSTGYGFIKQPDGSYNYKGATEHHVRLMRKHCAPSVRIKAAGGIRTLDQMLKFRDAGADRIGASATEAMLREAIRRGYGPAAAGLSESAAGAPTGGTENRR